MAIMCMNQINKIPVTVTVTVTPFTFDSMTSGLIVKLRIPLFVFGIPNMVMSGYMHEERWLRVIFFLLICSQLQQQFYT